MNASRRSPLLAAALALMVTHAAPAGTKGPATLAPPAALSEPAVWVDVRAPAKVRDALRSNKWLREALDKPLGKGFLGSWAAFLGSRGEDLRAAFKGAVYDAAVQPLFAQPFRIAWYTGRDATSSPALIVPAPSDALRLSFAALDQAARKGAVASSCPGEHGAPGILIGRWVVAEHVLFVGQREDRIVVARHPAAVLQAYCAREATVPAAGPDVEVALAPERVGRGAQSLASALGVHGPLRLQLAVEGDRLVAAGLAAELQGAPRLAQAAPPPSLLQLVPASAPVVLSASVLLPEKLDAASLRGFLAGAGGPALQRQVTFLWWPRGDARLQHEVALLWSRPEDDAGLAAIFNGKNKLTGATLCGQVAMASQPAVLDRLRRACEGQEPGLRDLGSGVVRGLSQRSSISLSVNLGRALSQLASDGYWSEQEGAPGAHGAAPADVEEALRALSALPFLGFAGTADKSALVPKGFGS
jgi:hypothetical protein